LKKSDDVTHKESQKPRQYWILKSEPGNYSIDDFKRDKKALWTGVRNYQARNFMISTMKPGDEFVFYHSNATPSAAMGIGKVLKVNVPDPTALDPKSQYYDAKASLDHPIWFCAEVAYTAHLKTTLSLADLRENQELASMELLKKGQRLSVLPLSANEFHVLKRMGGLAK
jgi:predicted RNA-binding protein with PUA-like domain